jgi:hypothetical protein
MGLPEHSQLLIVAQNNICQTWEHMLNTADVPDRDQPLTKEILVDPKHPVTKLLLYVYTIECYVYRTLNQASREADKTKVHTLGPYAQALYVIVTYAAKNRDDVNTKLFNDSSNPMELFRGTGQTRDQIQEYKDAVG